MKLNIQGTVVEVPDNWSEDKIAQVVSETKASLAGARATPVPVEAPAPQAKTAPSNTEFYLDRAKKGLGGTVEMLGGIVRGGASALGMTDDAVPGATAGERFGAGFKRVTDAKATADQELLGVQNFAPKDGIQKNLGAFVEGAADAANFIPGLGLAKAAMAAKGTGGAIARQALTGAVVNTPRNAIVGGAAGMGATVGVDAAKDMGGGETTQLVTGILTGLAGGMTGARVASVGAMGTQALTKTGRAAMAAGPDFIAKYAPGLSKGNTTGENLGVLKAAGTNAVNERGRVLANTQLQGDLKQAVIEGGDIKPLDKVLAENKAFGDEIGAPIPITAAMGDNRAVQELVGEAATQPQFRADIRAQTEAAQGAMATKSKEVFGDRETAINTLDEVIPKSTVAQEQLVRNLDEARSKKEVLEAQLASGAKTSEQVGKDIQEAYTATKKAAQAKANANYSQAVNGAAVRGEAIAPEVYAPIIGRVLTKADDGLKFANTGEVGKWLGVLKEKVLAGEQMFPQEVDAFKAAVNKALRKADTGASPDARYISELEDIKTMIVGKDLQASELRPNGTPLLPSKVPVVQGDTPGVKRIPGLVDMISPQFARELKAADTQYAKDVGHDLLSKTGKSIGREQFSSKLVNMVTNHPESAAQAIRAMGARGESLVKDALLTRLTSATGATGDVTPKVMSKFMKDYSEIISKVPGLGEELGNASKTLENLVNSEIQLKQEFANAAKDDILVNFKRKYAPSDPRAAGDVTRKYSDSTQLAEAVRTDPSTLKAFMVQYGRDKDAVEALRTIMYQDYLSKPNAYQSLMADLKKNRALEPFLAPRLDKLAQYTEKAEQLANNKVIPSGSVLKSTAKDSLQELTGVDIGQVVKTWRNMIQGVQTKGFITFGLFAEAAAKKERAGLLADTLLQPGVMEKAVEQLKLAEKAKTAMDVDKHINAGTSYIRKLLVPTREDLTISVNQGSQAATGEDQVIDRTEANQRLDKEQADRKALYGG